MSPFGFSQSLREAFVHTLLLKRSKSIWLVTPTTLPKQSARASRPASQNTQDVPNRGSPL